MPASVSLRTVGLWPGPPLLLASRSRGRADVLSRAGIPFDVVDPAVDERAIERAERLEPETLAQRLATAKAASVSVSYPNRIVVGADQILALDGQILHKAADIQSAVLHLKKLRGRVHRLHSAIACARDGATLFAFVETASIEMRAFSDATLEAYARAMGDKLMQTVGGYEIEGWGAHLIERMQGDIFTIIGMPLLALLQRLRAMRLIVDPERPA